MAYLKNRANIWPRLCKGIAVLLTGVFIFVHVIQLTHHHDLHGDDGHRHCDHEHHSDDSDDCLVCDYLIHKQSHYALYFTVATSGFFRTNASLLPCNDQVGRSVSDPETYTNKDPPASFS